MKKNRIIELKNEQLDKLVSMAQEKKRPFKAIKQEFGILEKEVAQLLKERLSKEQFEMWQKKIAAQKLKPKPVIDDFDDLDSKYYIKNKFD